MARVLVVDDEPDIALGLQLVLTRAGHATTTAGDGKAGLRALFELRPDLVLLDVAMPVMDGWETLERIRDVSAVPVLMLTARDAEAEKVRGLQGGADDYQTKPFSNQELLARVAALLRRPGQAAAHAAASVALAPAEGYVDDHVEVDFARRVTRAGGREVELTPLEFRLLRALVTNAGIVLSHERLLQLVWGDNAAVERGEVKTYVRYLRRKLGWDGGGPIASIRGVGYAYRPAAA